MAPAGVQLADRWFQSGRTDGRGTEKQRSSQAREHLMGRFQGIRAILDMF